MWRCVTCAISCASTEASSDSVSARGDQPGVHADEAAGQREGVDRRVADDEELEVAGARPTIAWRQPRAERRQVFRELGIVDVARVAAAISRMMLSPRRRSICGESSRSPAPPRSGSADCAQARGARAISSAENEQTAGESARGERAHVVYHSAGHGKEDDTAAP